jgi:hypothetical protein
MSDKFFLYSDNCQAPLAAGSLRSHLLGSVRTWKGSGNGLEGNVCRVEREWKGSVWECLQRVSRGGHKKTANLF